MTKIAIFSTDSGRFDELSEKVRRGGFEPATGRGDIALIDGIANLEAARGGGPVVMVLTSSFDLSAGALSDVDDFIVEPFSEAELRLRLKRQVTTVSQETKPIRVDGLVIYPDTYEVLIDGTPLNLTYKEYELLKFFAGHPERVWDRKTLLNQIWEYDYFGGTRTVDVHVRRLRAKLGPRYGGLIQTVRQVGYKFRGVESRHST